MSSEVIKLYKNLGETPLECIERFRAKNKGYEETNMTYLGRLDPMAEGVMLVLSGNTKDKDKYLSLDKTYEFEVLWGFETDTYDILGLVTNTGAMPAKLDFKMEKLLIEMREKKTQKYPIFSSKVFNKDFMKVRGKTSDLETPERGIKIFSIEHINTKIEKQEDILKEILDKIDLVKGDFRQTEIKDKWREVIIPGEKVLISHFKASVSSGTYIRSLAHEMGQKLGTSALAYSIKRTRVGEYKI
ncbi:MAG TPA: hypothetical protein PLD99_01990 [Parcubacteria group bacterium]|nr:hypothetical protein [Parcubacteria group bacterium]